MKVIGITGGVGAGKTQVLSYIEEHYSCRVLRADEAAHLLEQPGQACYEQLVKLLGKDILQGEQIDKQKMAAVIFQDKEILAKINAVIHPAVKHYILEQIAYERERGAVDYFFIEAALLIEDRYDLIVDESWYVHSDIEVRRQRLAKGRQYSAQKIEAIMQGQLSEMEFRRHCNVVISNNGDLEETYRQIRELI